MAKKNENKQTLEPKLRFPEFRNLRQWEEEPLKKFLTEHKRKSDGNSEVHSVSVHKGVINQEEHLGRSFAASDTSYYNLVRPYDVIYTKSPTGDFPFGIVKQSRLKSNVIVSPLYGVFAPTNKHIGYIIDSYFESSYRATSYLDPITQKGAKNTIQITNSTFLSGGLFLPSDAAEQQKIADCLGSLDDLIAAHCAKLEAFQSHKKGLLQQLFPAEGQTSPTRRFPEFENEGEWGKGKAGDVFKNRSERGVAGLEIYSVTMNDGMVKRSSLDRKFGDIAKPSGNKRVYRDDIVYNMMRMWQGASGVAPADCMVSPAYIVLTPKKNACSDFFGNLFKLPHSKQVLTAHSRGLTEDRLRLYYDDFASISLRYPKSPEQQKIADCLNSLDALITAQIEEITALKKHKKGLMQQLFPNPELSKA